MTDPALPSVPPTPPTEQQLVYDILAALATLAGTLGIALPALFQSQQILMTIAGAIVALGGAGYSLYRHFNKTDKIKTMSARLTRLAMVATTSQKRMP